MNIHTADNAMYADGAAVIATYSICAVYGIMFILILLSNIRNLFKRKEESSKEDDNTMYSEDDKELMFPNF